MCLHIFTPTGTVCHILVCTSMFSFQFSSAESVRRSCATLAFNTIFSFFLFLRSNAILLYYYPYISDTLNGAQRFPIFIELIGRFDAHIICSSVLACKVIWFVRKYRRTNVVLCHIKLLCLFDSFDSARLFHFRRCRRRRQHFHLHFTYFVCFYFLSYFVLFVSFVCMVVRVPQTIGYVHRHHLEKMRSKERS